MAHSERFNATDLADLIETEEDGDPGLLADLIRDFSSQSEKALEEMASAHASGLYRDLERHAHSLKSSARLLGLRATSVICEAIEDKAHENSFDPACLVGLRSELFPALEELKNFSSHRLQSLRASVPK